MKRPWKLVQGLAINIALGLLLAVAVALPALQGPLATLASDADVSVADVVAPTGSVTLAPGDNAPINIKTEVTGNQTGTATFEVYRNWTLSGGTFVGSNSQEFTVPPREPSDPKTVLSTTGTVTVAAGQADGTFTLAVGAFDITNTNTTGAKLNAGSSSSYDVIVQAPTPSDTTKPTVNCTPPSTTPWYGNNQSVPCTASDSGTGLANSGDASFSLSTNVADGSDSDSAMTSGPRQVCDQASPANCTTVGPFGPFKIDRKDPTISITTPANNATYTLGQPVAANYSCSDGSGSGVESCTGPVADGSNINTSSVGSKSFTVDAEDEVGNTNNKTVNYSVIYNWTGFFQPVDNPGDDNLTYNSVKAGSSIPVKFSLGGNQGLSIFAAGSPSSGVIACKSTAELDPIEQTLTAGSSSLSYDSATNQYVYVWKTDKAWGGTCRQLLVKLDDGTSHRANFSFSK